MLFTKSLLFGAFAMASTAAAQGAAAAPGGAAAPQGSTTASSGSGSTAGGAIAFTVNFKSVSAGQTVPITWSGGDGSAVEIDLREGSASNLGAPVPLTTSATGGSYQWSVSSSLPSGSDFALQIKQGSAINYSQQFSITGGTGTGPLGGSSSGGSGNSTVSSSSSGNSTTSGSAASSSGSAPSSAAASSTGTATATASVTTTAGSAATSSAAASPLSSPTTTSAPKSGAAVALGVSSPLALVFTVIAAMLYLH